MYEHCMKLKTKSSLSSVIHKRYKNNNPTPGHVHFTKWRQSMRAIACIHPDIPVHSACSLYHASWHICKLCMRTWYAPWHDCARCMLSIPCLLTCLQSVHALFACNLTRLCAVYVLYPMPPDMLANCAYALFMHPDMPFAQCMLAVACLLTCLQTVHARFSCSLYHDPWHAGN